MEPFRIPGGRKGDGEEFELNCTMQPLEKAEASPPGPWRFGPRQCYSAGRTELATMPGPAATFSPESGLKKRRGRHSCRSVHRPGCRQPNRTSHPISLPGANLRRCPQSPAIVIPDIRAPINTTFPGAPRTRRSPPSRIRALLFERLFGAGAPGERRANIRRRQEQQRSILDFVLDDARVLQRQLASRDKQKLDEYLGQRAGD